SLSPENPLPNEPVTVTVTSFLSNLDTSTITWSINGRKVASGIGMKSFTTTIGNVGSKTVVDVKIVTTNGITITDSVPIGTATVDLVWEAQSYTPPFYQGKALLTPYETVKIVAIPHFSQSSTSLSPKNLIYTWSRDGRVMGSLSGYGKNTLTLFGSETSKLSTIRVTVTNTDGTVTALGETSIRPSKPSLISYIYSPAYGTLYNFGLQGSFVMPIKELNIEAVPYYFDATPSTIPYIRYEWKMNNVRVDSPLNNMLTVRNEGTTTGSTNISVTATLPAGNTTQNQSTSFTLTF
ncbi:MAG: seg, partial [Candidatus Paceibacter sp.]|nr:seg [Candidatus Paceibacter sp.]